MSLLTPQRPTAGAHTDSAATMVPNQSRAERTTSYAVADFPLPTGPRGGVAVHAGRPPRRAVPRRGHRRAPGAGARAARRRDARHGIRRGVAAPAAPRRRATAPRPWPPPTAAASPLLDVPAEAELDEPVRIRLTGTEHEVVHGHLLVRVGRFARATVVLEHTGVSDYSELLSVVVGDGASSPS